MAACLHFLERWTDNEKPEQLCSGQLYQETIRLLAAAAGARNRAQAQRPVQFQR
jgi:hypothetical protein